MPPTSAGPRTADQWAPSTAPSATNPRHHANEPANVAARNSTHRHPQHAGDEADVRPHDGQHPRDEQRQHRVRPHPPLRRVDIRFVDQEVAPVPPDERAAAGAPGDIQQPGAQRVPGGRDGAQRDHAGDAEMMVTHDEPAADRQDHFAREMDRHALADHEPEDEEPLEGIVRMTERIVDGDDAGAADQCRDADARKAGREPIQRRMFRLYVRVHRRACIIHN